MASNRTESTDRLSMRDRVRQVLTRKGEGAPPCAKCQRRAEQDRREQEARAAARARRQAEWEKEQARPRPRLPDGATFLMTYDAAAVEWTGLLEVSALGLRFEGKGRSFEPLARNLAHECWEAMGIET